MVEFSDRIGIMYSGELIEVANSQDILENPYHPYTKGLGSSFPPLTGPKTKLAGIPGNPLNLLEIPEGCRFQARCDRVHETCTKVPTKLRSIDPGHLSNCHLYGDHMGVLEPDGVVGNMVMRRVLPGNIRHQSAEFARGGGRAAFALQDRKADPPFGLAPAVLARQLVKPPLERLPEPEIVSGQGKNAAI